MLLLPPDIVQRLHTAPFARILDLWQEVLRLFPGSKGMAALGHADRFFLLTTILHRPDAIHPWLYARCREVEQESDGCLDLWAREHYKGQRLQDIVPTPHGWTRFGDLQVGDWLFGHDGKPCRVIARTPVFHDPECYEVFFDDGVTCTVSSQHRWLVERRTRKRVPGTFSKDSIGKRLYREPVIMSTEEIIAHGVAPDRRLAISVNEPLQLPEAELPVHPYLLGLWLGDGTSATGSITCKDAEVFDIVKSCGYALSHNITPRDSAERRTVYGLGATLRKLGLLHNKHIPGKYLRASEVQRHDLLQGLMDTDGHCNDRGTATFCNKNEALVDGVYELACSLGLKPNKYRLEGNHGSYWHVAFQAYQAYPVFKIRRKRERCKRGSRPAPRRYIVGCRKVETVPMRCIQVDSPDGLYLTGRAMVTTHNSTIITFTGIIQEIIRNPEITIGLFSHSMKPAKKFLLMIKTELENNEELKALYPHIFWTDPDREAPAAGRQWNSFRIDVKRTSNPREGTLECSGLVDGQPTGSHFRLRVYDDVVTRESVSSPEMIEKTTSAWELSDNLGARGEDGKSRAWHIGTRYHFADTYHHILEKRLLKPRVHPATDNGRVDGKPVFLSPAVLKEKIAIQGSNFPAQMLQNPAAGQNATFQKEWLKFSDIRPATVNIYVMGDPASSKKKGSDSTAIPVIAVDAARNKYLVDGFCHKMNLRERWLALRELRRKWRNRPGVQGVFIGYEKYGMQSDMEYFQEQMEIDRDSFPITELNWTKDGTQSKEDRVQRLVPDFLKGQFFLALETQGETANQKRLREVGQGFRIMTPPKAKDHEGNLYSLNKKFLDEYLFFPFAVHDDLIDACSRIYDMDYQPPVIIEAGICEPEVE